MKLSVAIINYNEEIIFECCSQSVLPLADDIVVVDSYSSDPTEQICQQSKVIFMKEKFREHIQQKIMPLSVVQPEVTPNLKNHGTDDAYTFNLLKNNYATFNHSGFYC